ncbi:MAG TPA: hypothetical protein VGF10_09115, partial [Gaiella sp.]
MELGEHTERAERPSTAPAPDLSRSRELNARLSALVPGGSHTYAKGDDQFPEDLAPIMERGSGCHVWDV